MCLFVSNSDKTVSKNSISRWIREAVLKAYDSASASDKKLVKVKAHEVRAISTSLLFF